jgi:hypothetical protein
MWTWEVEKSAWPMGLGILKVDVQWELILAICIWGNQGLLILLGFGVLHLLSAA